MSPVIELDSLEADEFRESLVNEAGCPKRVIGPFAAKLPVGELVEFRIHQGGELVHRTLVTGAMGTQKIGDVVQTRRLRGTQINHSPRRLPRIVITPAAQSNM